MPNDLHESNSNPLRDDQPSEPRCACPVCGGELIAIRAKLVCSVCHTICETCCEGGRG